MLSKFSKVKATSIKILAYTTNVITDSNGVLENANYSSKKCVLQNIEFSLIVSVAVSVVFQCI